MGLKLLFTVPYGLFLARVDPNRGTFDLDLIQDSCPEYYGITWDGVGPILSHDPPRESDVDRDPAGAAAIPRGFLSFWRGAAGFPSKTALLGPHQIECLGSKTAAVDTGQNRLVFFRSETGDLDLLYPDPSVKRDWNDRGQKVGRHFNSVHLDRANKVLYLVAHGHEARSSLWSFSWPYLVPLDVFPLEARWAHNVAVLPEGVLVCDSRDSSLLNVTTGDRPFRAHIRDLHKLTRGLAVTDSWYVVGWMERCERGERPDCRTGIHLLPRKEDLAPQTLEFGRIGALRDLRVIDPMDLAHNLQPFDPSWLRDLRIGGVL